MNPLYSLYSKFISILKKCLENKSEESVVVVAKNKRDKCNHLD